ncbi:uncharacterized protein B0H18DRAFT_210891 [Fomitopsis serialis]|uniref:uncharacterized protein n=1 Tax=Fomitopsis serialis TaxID=139415 RepID=UPI002008C0DB|nr:uncharacterized protein B0H18DRAFT_210891 [Neoantrodia serialis]KAH9929430.1 hypothetical protein B0H18DRAFT_210891 [Neoantrodia serialis]
MRVMVPRDCKAAVGAMKKMMRLREQLTSCQRRSAKPTTAAQALRHRRRKHGFGRQAADSLSWPG